MTTAGARISVLGHIGTIRYSGTVAGYPGEWLGVEWDEPSRGKHDGRAKDGTRYFDCRAPGTPASFIRPSATISYGKTFLDALADKYVDTTAFSGGSSNVESVVLGSSGGAIVVEAPRLADVRHRLARLDNLRLASLSDELVSGPGGPGEIRARNLRLETLDLSRSLLATWRDVFLIVSQLPHIKTLILNDNRIAPVTTGDSELIGIARDCGDPHLQELSVNNCLLSSHELWTLTSVLRVSRLEAANNRLTSLGIQPGSSVFQNLESLNLTSNLIVDWPDFARTIWTFDALRELIVSENLIERIPAPDLRPLPDAQPRPSLRSLALTSNRISSWASMDALVAWFPDLERLNVQENPFLDDPSTVDVSRQLLIARFSELVSCNGSPVSAHERKDSELFYLSFVARNITSPEERRLLPRWEALCQKHGAPDTGGPTSNYVALRNNLGSRLTEIYVRQLALPPPSETTSLDALGFEAASSPVTLKVLPSMTLKIFRAKALKSLKLRIPPGKTVRMWVVYHVSEEDRAGSIVARELDLEADGAKELDFWNIENGTGVGVLIS